MQPTLIIVGAGLSGLLLAYLLQPHYCITLLESRTRVGGRILTVKASGEAFDLGPTWIWPHQENIRHLISVLGLQLFNQYDRGAFAYDAPEGVEYFRTAPAPAYRIEQGASALTDALHARLDATDIHLGKRVVSVTASASGVQVDCGDDRFESGQCIITVPPRLAANTIYFSPSLPSALRSRMDATPTWMGFSSKCIITYSEPFWRARGLSGFATSHRGPLSEVHDASSGAKGALFGFYGSADADDAQPEQVIEQLRRLFGDAAAAYEYFRYHNWRTDPHTSVTADRQPLQAHPDYGLRATYHPRVHFGGTETAFDEGGYLEGAVIAATALARTLMASHPK